jgi:lipoic acid synthetase
VARACSALGLKYVVLTSVDRDDLEDGGALLFSETINQINSLLPEAKVEALIPDFSGNNQALHTLVESSPAVIGHNVETVRRLSPGLRDPRASYDLSLRVLETVAMISPQAITKSSLMLGLGEQPNEVLETLHDLRDVGVKALTLGQYLPPSKNAAPLVRYVSPEEFQSLAKQAQDMGFCFVMSGPLVRSSYKAAQTVESCSD